MRISLADINRADFYVNPRNIPGYGDVFLIIPKKGKHKWLPSEFHLRSLLCDLDGNIISSGFPKFLNVSENSALDKITYECITDGKVFFPEKMDGSLIVRDVLPNGQVNIRTRGSHSLGDFHNKVMGLIREKYPKILDPSVFPSMSLLFEFTSPDNRIILEYDKPALTLLGAMKLHEDFLPYFICGTPEMNVLMAETLEVDPLVFHELSSNLEECISFVKSLQDSEGVVAWCIPGDTIGHNDTKYVHMAKIKASAYLKIHYLRFHLTSSKMSRICYALGLETDEEFRELIFSIHGDYEVYELLLPEFRVFTCERQRRMQEVIDFITTLSAQEFHFASKKRRYMVLRKFAEDYGHKKFVHLALAIFDEAYEKALKYSISYSLDISPGSLGKYLSDGEEYYETILENIDRRRENV